MKTIWSCGFQKSMGLFFLQMIAEGKMNPISEPLISVIVPVYKVEPWLERCVTSIRNQSYRNLEIILVDDGSPDRCGNICDYLAQNDSRIRVVHRENGGLSAARNTGLDICRGEYVGFVDSDDVIHPEMYSRLYADIQRFGTSLAFCQALICYEQNVSFPCVGTSVKCFSGYEVLYNSLYDLIWFSAWSKLYHKSLFDGIRYPEGRTNEDFPVTTCIFGRCDRIAVDFNQLYAYCKRDGSITTSSSSRNLFDQVISAEEVLIHIKKTNPSLAGLAARILFSACLGFLLKSDGRDSLEEVKTMREKVYGIIRNYYPDWRDNQLLSFSQKSMLTAARIGESLFGMVSRLRKAIKTIGKSR